ncbi:MAG: cation ABC transporter permease [Rhodospirillales bacterium 20-64-7]|nr:MAG: cation ABC transporter permease [Rhodospirillales bacterium 20-64-7]
MFASFMVNTWITASLVAVASGLVGYFVVLRSATFAAHALPLGTFPGAAAAGLLGINPLWGLLAFAAAGVAGIAGLGRRQRNDVATALTLIVLLGLGTLFLSLSRQYAQGVEALMFGEVLGISSAEIVPVAVMTLLVAAGVFGFFRPLLLSAASPDLAAARGAAPAAVQLLFLSLLALTTAIALPVVGALLVFSLIVGPASAARACTPRPVLALLLSVIIALGLVWAAIALSFETNWPVGFFVGALAAGCYAAGRLRRRTTRRTPWRRRPRTAPPPPRPRAAA